MRCDVSAHAYQSTFEPNTEWSEEYAQGGEILAYWKSVAKKYDVYNYIRFNQKIQRQEWNGDAAQWTLYLHDQQTGNESQQTFDFVILATGFFNAWRLPDYPGINDYRGHLRHSSNWDTSFDPKGKRVALIGNGASGVQMLPELQATAGHVDHYARSKTWIAGSLTGKQRSRLPIYFTEEQKTSFKDPETYRAYRKEVESSYFRRFGTYFKGTTQNRDMREDME